MRQLQESFNRRMQALTGYDRAIFRTTASVDLWETYLSAFPESRRQHHNCCACRRFIQMYGHLVTVTEFGHLKSVVWGQVDEYHNIPIDYEIAVEAMRLYVERSQIAGVFYSKETTWGTPVTGVWQHMAIVPPASAVFRSLSMSAFQASAAKADDRKNVQRAVREFKLDHLNVAMQLLESNALYRAEHVIGPVRWLRDLKRASLGRPNWENFLWREVANAPAGFCHPRASMAGSLLEDIAAGMDFEKVSRRFADKMDPTKLQRPQELPKAGNIAQAEKLVAQLGVANSLKRRFCRPDEVVALWTPPAAEVKGGVFADVKARGTDPEVVMVTSPINITWVKFQRDVLPGAKRIQYLSGAYAHGFHVLMTAADADAPPILQWDSVAQRNPVSWYVWATTPVIVHFGLKPKTWYDVSHVTLMPCSWYGGNQHHGNGAIFLLPDAKETRRTALGLFPECLKSDFHGIRAVIEAYARNTQPTGEGPFAIGPAVVDGSRNMPRLDLRVTSDGVVTQYALDRWD